MKPLEVTAIQRGCVYDGHGVRTTIFLRGCPFTCPWCCNPETLNKNPTFFLNDDKCLKLKGITSSLCSECERNGGDTPLQHCPFGVYEPVFKLYSTYQLLQEVKRDEEVFRESRGGVTLSGGDPLIHAETLIPFLKKLSNEGISCAIETTLYFKRKEVFQSIIPFIKEWIVDLKLQSENYKRDYLDIVTRNLTLLRKNDCELQFRIVYVNSLNVNDILKAFDLFDVNIVEVIECHSLSKVKYDKLGLTFTDYSPSGKGYNKFVSDLINNGIKVIQLKT